MVINQEALCSVELRALGVRLKLWVDSKDVQQAMQCILLKSVISFIAA